MKLIILTFFVLSAQLLAAYNPATKKNLFNTTKVQFTYTYNNAPRNVKLTLYSPEQKDSPIILLSHGLGGNRDTGKYLAIHWASRGFVVVAMQHSGSDSDVIKNAPRGKKLLTLKKAASLVSFQSRVHDVSATIDQLKQWNKQDDHLLNGKLNLAKLAIGGHSFGAITAQASSGQFFPLGINTKYTDKRVKAALMMSPSSPKDGKHAKAFGNIQIPWMCMTGTKDTSIITPAVTVDTRKKVYQHLPATNNKYQLVLKGAQHFAFSDRNKIGMPQRNKNHHQLIIAFSTAFYEAHLKNNKIAKSWLHSNTPNQMLETGDTWEKK